MKILAVGNSFSQDATTYLHQMAASRGVDLAVYNLYIGGCSLERHWRNVVSGDAAYELQRDGAPTGRMVSIGEMLGEGGFDAVVTQQASHDSGWMDSYEPFLTDLTAYFRERAPGARLMLQQTWAYEIDSAHEAFFRYHRDQKEMYARLSACYAVAARTHGMTLIPCGEIVQRARELPGFRYALGERSLCRDGFHMSLNYGRYLLACAWLRALTGESVADLPFIPDGGETVDPALLAVVRRAVEAVMG